MEDDIRKLTDVRPNASVSIDARGNSVVDRSAQHTNRYNSVAVSTKSIDQKLKKEELERARRASELHQQEVDSLKLKIRELDLEVQK